MHFQLSIFKYKIHLILCSFLQFSIHWCYPTDCISRKVKLCKIISMYWRWLIAFLWGFQSSVFLQCYFTISTLCSAVLFWLIAHGSLLGFINALLPFAVGRYGQITRGLPSPFHLCGTFPLLTTGKLIFSLGHWCQYDHLSIKPQRQTFCSFTSASRHRSDHALRHSTPINSLKDYLLFSCSSLWLHLH